MCGWWDYDNPDRSLRHVQCPECGYVGFSGKLWYQCGGKIRHRMNTDENALKSTDDRIKERQEQNEELKQELEDLEKYYTTTKARIKRILQQLKPLDPPKSVETKPEPEKQTVAV